MPPTFCFPNLIICSKDRRANRQFKAISTPIVAWTVNFWMWSSGGCDKGPEDGYPLQRAPQAPEAFDYGAPVPSREGRKRNLGTVEARLQTML